MLTITCSGRLMKTPVERTGKNGSTYTTASLIVGSDPDTVFVNLTVFDEDCAAVLAECKRGEEVCASGTAKISVYDDKDKGPRPSISLNVHRLMTAGTDARTKSRIRKGAPNSYPPKRADEFDDPIPF